MNWFKFLIIFTICSQAFAKVETAPLTEETLSRFERVPEFAFIQEEANKLGVKVYLFGGTASAFAHYVRWDLEREAGDDKYQKERFDYDFTNIYRGNQDLDIVVDGTAEQAKKLHQALLARYSHFSGIKEDWEVRLLRQDLNDKGALLDNKDFKNQHTDSNSIGLLHLTALDKSDVYKDLHDWNNLDSNYLQDIANARIKFIYSSKHESTSRYKKDLNPPILAAVRYLAKLTQYEVKGSKEDLEAIITSGILDYLFDLKQDFSKETFDQYFKSLLLSRFDTKILEKYSPYIYESLAQNNIISSISSFKRFNLSNHDLTGLALFFACIKSAKHIDQEDLYYMLINLIPINYLILGDRNNLFLNLSGKKNVDKGLLKDFAMTLVQELNHLQLLDDSESKNALINFIKEGRKKSRQAKFVDTTAITTSGGIAIALSYFQSDFQTGLLSGLSYLASKQALVSRDYYVGHVFHNTVLKEMKALRNTSSPEVSSLTCKGALQ